MIDVISKVCQLNSLCCYFGESKKAIWHQFYFIVVKNVAFKSLASCDALLFVRLQQNCLANFILN